MLRAFQYNASRARHGGRHQGDAGAVLENKRQRQPLVPDQGHGSVRVGPHGRPGACGPFADSTCQTLPDKRAPRSPLQPAARLRHGAGTNGAGPGYADRADPAYWAPVLERWPKLKVCLAHFGGFGYPSVGAPAGSDLPESSWEWTIGRLIKARPEVGLFADLSYLSAVLAPDLPALDALARTFKTYAQEFDPSLTHLLFGSDWVMLGREKGYTAYAEKLVSFLSLRC